MNLDLKKLLFRRLRYSEYGYEINDSEIFLIRNKYQRLLSEFTIKLKNDNKPVIFIIAEIFC